MTTTRLGPFIFVFVPLWMLLVEGPFWLRWGLPFGAVTIFLIVLAVGAVRETAANHRKYLAGEIDR